MSLSLLLYGSQEEKLEWTFHLYDLNGDGLLSREEIRDVTTSVGRNMIVIDKLGLSCAKLRSAQANYTYQLVKN